MAPYNLLAYSKFLEAQRSQIDLKIHYLHPCAPTSDGILADALTLTLAAVKISS